MAAINPGGAVTRRHLVQGFGEVRRNIAQLARNYPKKIAIAAKAEVNLVKEECIEATPRDTGDLRASITVIEPEIERGRIHTGIFAGDAISRTRTELTETYALKVHEDMYAFHKVGGPKFIENPWNKAAPHLANRIGNRLQKKGYQDLLRDE